MPLPDVPLAAVELIKSFEGIPDGDPSTVNIDAYLCPAGVWTIGWGHALVDRGAQLKGAANRPRARALYPGGITRAQAQLLLQADLIPRCASVLSLVKAPLDDGALGALVAFVFNVGSANFAASTLLRRLNAGDSAGAADQFLAWDKARVDGVLKALAGLTRRRKAERAMFLGQDWRAAGAVGVSRSRGVLPGPLPVPESPESPESPEVPEAPEVPEVPEAHDAPDQAPTKARPPAAKKLAAKKGGVKAVAAKPAPPLPAAVKPRARTTKPKARPPSPPAKRRAPRTAR